jgi:SNF2 family DNA or RNA helicase
MSLPDYTEKKGITMPSLLTPHQSQYVAWLLTRRAASESVESLASTLVDSQVDLNPHQVEAALFACRNPLSRGVILADEVGLGKTLEAGLVISQRWAERRRNYTSLATSSPGRSETPRHMSVPRRCSPRLPCSNEERHN